MEKIKRKNSVFDIEQIRERLPHRYPFLMVDRIIERKPGYCKGIKNVTINECYFLGHFPQQAIMPGMLIAECMAQTAAFVELPLGEVSQLDSEKGIPKKAFLVTMNVKFMQPVIPGDQLVIEVSFIKKIGKMTMFQAKVTVDGMLVANGEFATVDIE
ncbi:MAG: 3-hydroxyacyl-ACP dehydratase FabZ [Nitrososphaeria archaeon]